ncbi:hypothetical protein [Salibaculum sp.]|uniref:hypothetical protein n=1 Tax=Salibaculum sp. TaxID=2855480 RepID=UPI002B4800DC|nr:hypothetical protein [Salibaculum sp.]HKL68634.1 hypothetical protein [Salibaculum sp.]
MVNRKSRILASLAVLFVLLATGSGLLFYHEGDDAFGGLTGFIGFVFVVLPLGTLALVLVMATLRSWRNDGNRLGRLQSMRSGRCDRVFIICPCAGASVMARSGGLDD